MYQLVIPLSLHIETPLAKSYPAKTIIFTRDMKLRMVGFLRILHQHYT